MKAEDLKRWPLLFKKFKKNIEKHPLSHETFEEYQKDTDGDISEAFAWQDSKQGHSFWEALYSDNLVYAIFLQPKLFSIDNQVVEDPAEGRTLSAHTEYIIALASGSVVLENSCSLDEIKSTMEELEYYYNTIKGIGCSIRACYHSDGSGSLVRCDCDGNNPIVLMSWGKIV